MVYIEDMTEIVYKPRRTRIPYDVFMKHIKYFVMQVRAERNDERFIRLKADEMRQFIHECGQHHTGYISVEALRVMDLKARGFKTPERVTLEHFNSRLNSAKKIVQHILDWEESDYIEELYDEIYDLVLRSCRVHKTTAEENQLLTAIQHDPKYVNAGWREQYKAANIELVYCGTSFRMGTTEYRCFSKRDLMELFNVSAYRLEKMIKENERARATSQ